MRLGVSPAATSTPMGVFNQWFKALFPHTETLGCAVCLWVLQLLPCQLATALTTQIHNLPPCWVHQPLPCCEFSLPWLPVSTPPTGLDECFNSLVVRLPHSSIFCQFWLLLFSNCCCPSLGCVRRHSVSPYAFILAGSPEIHF